MTEQNNTTPMPMYFYNSHSKENVLKEVLKIFPSPPENNISATDDCALCEILGVNIKIIEGSPSNIKITRLDDLKMSAAILCENGDEKVMR